MCTAMLGATPVNRWTWAASSAFSHGVRGTPGWPNTLNRVPVFPNAQEGSSISCCRRAALTAARSRIPFISTSTLTSMPGWSVQVEDLGDPLEPLIRRPAVQLGEVRRHLRLPAPVDCGSRHPVECGLVVIGFQITDQEPVLGEEEAVVTPPSIVQRCQHLRPHRFMPSPVLLQPLRPHPPYKTHPLHPPLPPCPRYVSVRVDGPSCQLLLVQRPIDLYPAGRHSSFCWYNGPSTSIRRADMPASAGASARHLASALSEVEVVDVGGVEDERRAKQDGLVRADRERAEL